LSILERLNSFPTESSELNTWWVEEFGTKPLKQRVATASYAAHEGSSSDEDSDAGDDWRKFFDGENADNDTEIANAKVPSVRFRKLTVHQSLHSLAAHRAVFTQTWLLLLPRLSISDDSKNFVVRALSVMHRGVLPHITRPVLVMDWVGACVDQGTPLSNA
jgi:U3 small nucleolar RNA-associated protein 19